MFSNRIIQLTADGSHTVAIPGLNLTYHSRHGAIQESMHVFIQAGLQHVFALNRQPFSHTLHVFEVGFGTGLNALMSLNQAIQVNKNISYTVIEPFPLSMNEAEALNYASLIDENLKKSFQQMHRCAWNQVASVHPLFSIKKINIELSDFKAEEKFNLVYFDAFDPNLQPELWTETIFKKMYALLEEDGVLVTYSSKGAVRRAMQAAGFSVEKLPGAAGKREMLRAIKPA